MTVVGGSPIGSQEDLAKKKIDKKKVLAFAAIAALLLLFVTLSNPGWFTPQTSLPAQDNQDIFTVSDAIDVAKTPAGPDSDGDGGTSIATVTINVISVNDAPVANDDYTYTTLSNPIWIDALENDNDAEGDVLQISSVSPTPDGTASIENGGTVIVFTPKDGFAGDTYFTYSVSDGTSMSTGNVFVHVYPFKFGKILSPVGDGDHEFQQGDTANVRFKLTDQNNDEVLNAMVILQIQQVNAANNPIGPIMNATSAGGSNDDNIFRYSSSAKLYQYNLKTDTMAIGKWALYVYLIDMSTQPATYILLENSPIDHIAQPYS